MKKAILVSLIFIFAVTGQAFANDVAKIGVIDFQMIIQKSSAGKIIQKKLKAKKQELVDRINAERKALNTFLKNLESEKLVLTQEQLIAKERTRRIKINDLKDLQERASRELKMLETKLLDEAQKEVTAIVGELGKKEGFLLVLEKNTSSVIYRPDHVDITDRVIKLYNLKIANKKN